MKRLLLLALFAATAASAKAPAERWLDPECFEVGRAPMRTGHLLQPMPGDTSTLPRQPLMCSTGHALGS